MNPRPPRPTSPVPAVGVVIWKRGQVLLIQRGHPPNTGIWTLPGGRQEFGETTAEAARREVAEETGLAIELLGIVDVVDLIGSASETDPGYHFTVTEWVARWVSETARAGDDAAALAWVSPDAFEDLEVSTDVRRIVAESRRFL